MQWDDKYEELVRVAVHLLDDEQELSPDANLGELGLDSLESVGLLMALEEHYGVAFSDEMLMAETFSTPAKLWAAVSVLIAEANEPSGMSSPG